jgi:hypothetical protein
MYFGMFSGLSTSSKTFSTGASKVTVLCISDMVYAPLNLKPEDLSRTLAPPLAAVKTVLASGFRPFGTSGAF